VDDRACLNGILFVLATRIGWERLPQQLGYGSGMTCWRRLRDWQAAGVWHRLHALLPAVLRAAGRLELTRAIADSAHVRALKGGRQAAQARSYRDSGS
jgi:transposase